jgi:glycosyltransferase involved in cell wall biosynthesis
LPSQPIFGALVRTTGARNPLLLEALESVALQSLPCLAIVVVHGSEDAYAQVKAICGDASTLVLHASTEDPLRRRGYPINVGVDYCLSQLPHIQYLFLLDDDDIVYPFFTRMMAAAFEASQADVVYSTANCRETGKPLAQAYPLKPYYHLFDRNFIPSNSYAIRAETLRRTPVQVDEDMDAFEDWLFLLRLLERGFRFEPLDATLSEFRTDSAADSRYRYDLDRWNASALRVREYINQTAFPTPGGYLAALAERDQQESPPNEDRFADSSTTAALHRRIWDLEHSLSWNLTAPLRTLAGGLLTLRSRLKARV